MKLSRPILAVFVTAFALGGCGSQTQTDDVLGDEAIDEGALSVGARSLVGHYASDEDTYATELNLESNGTFTAQFNPRAVGVTLACVRAPCLAQGDGAWNVGSSGRLTLKVKHLTGTSGTKSITFKQRLTRGIIPMLFLDRVTSSLGEQTFRGEGTAGPGCAVTRCASGHHCIERSDGVASCVADPAVSECASNSDCRAVDDYCTGCDCRALKTGKRLPVCTNPGVRCIVAPCASKTVACVAGTCTVN